MQKLCKRVIIINDYDKKGDKMKNSRKQKLEKIWKDIEKIVMNESEQQRREDLVRNLISGIKKRTMYSTLKGDQRNYVLKKLEGLIREGEKEEKEVPKKEEPEKKNKEDISRIWRAIVEIVNREAKKTGQNTLEIWDKISEDILTGNKVSMLNINIPEQVRDDIIKLVEGQIKQEGLDYFEDVKNYTQNFEFLTGFRDITFAAYGHRRFSKPEYSKMFENMVAKLRENKGIGSVETEEQFLKRALSEKLVHTYYGRKIVEERIDRIEKDNDKYIRDSFVI